jgi:hypothetical protein
MKPYDLMPAGFWRLSIGIMWYVEVMVRGLFIQRPMLRDVVVAGVGCVHNKRLLHPGAVTRFVQGVRKT